METSTTETKQKTCKHCGEPVPSMNFYNVNLWDEGYCKQSHKNAATEARQLQALAGSMGHANRR